MIDPQSLTSRERWFMCSSKRAYDSEHNALQSRAFRNTINIRAYHCPVCRGWHLTKRDAPNSKNFKTDTS